jgi:hypothetical protein
MGPRYDRSWEHLGMNNRTIIAIRKRLLHIVRDFEARHELPHRIMTAEQNDMRHIACIVTTLPARTDPKHHIEELLKKEKYWEITAQSLDKGRIRAPQAVRPDGTE